MWGKSELRSDDQPPRVLARLADVVRFIGERDELPSKRAAELVLDKLAIGPVHGAFMLRRGDFARPVSDADVWRKRYPSGVEFLQALRREDAAWSRAGMVYLDPDRWNMPAHEAKQRGMAVHPDDEENGVYISEGKWPSVPELPALRGWSGLVEWLRYCWVQHAAAFSDLDVGEHAHVALLASDAAELFGFGVETTPAPAPAPVVALRLVDTEPAPTPAPANELSVKRRQAVARLRALQGTKGARQKVAEEFSIRERTVGKWLAIVEQEEAASRAGTAFSANLAQLQAS